jgi:ribosomal-protein-alanine N-acetyltransferase
MNIRLMKAVDLAAVSQIDELSFSQPWPPAAFEIELANKNARCWVAELDLPLLSRAGVDTGSISQEGIETMCLPREHRDDVAVLRRTGTENHGVVAALVLWRVLDEAHIATIAVHPDFRRQGIGKILLQVGMQAAYVEGARIYHLEVRAGNLAAQKMYVDFGYEIAGCRPKYYKDNGEDALLMTLDLSLPNRSQFQLKTVT